MGVTKFSTDLIKKYYTGQTSVIELGAQNLYDGTPVVEGLQSREGRYPYADVFYKKIGFKEYDCIDISEENNCIIANLSKKYKSNKEYDLVTDFGTSEHIDNYYMCWLNKFNLCKEGGLIISENPKTGNWKGHGYNYIDIDFYNKLTLTGVVELVEYGEHPAMGNVTDGWNIYAVLKKIKKEFITEIQFKQLPVYDN